MTMSREKYIVEFKGILGTEYDLKYETYFTDIKDIIKELCSKLRGFRDRIIRLSKDGFEYTLMKQDGKFIILPIICGAGIGRIFKVLAPVLAVAGAIFTAGALTAALLSTTILGMSSGTMLMIGGALLAVGTLLSKPSGNVQGAESDTSANKTSNYMGLEQGIPSGTPVPLGYGMILVPGTSIYASLNSIRGNVEVQDYLQESGR